MTLNLSIERDVEEKLAASARSFGQSLEMFIVDVLEREAAAAQADRSLTGAARATAFRDWAKAFPSTASQLSLEDVSRESIYGRD